MKSLIPLMRSPTWMQIYRRKLLLDHCPMIIIFSGYTLARNSSMENHVWRECVPVSLCENPSLYLPKESVSDLMDGLVFIWEVIDVFWWFIQTFFSGVSPVATGYESSMVIIYAQMWIGQRFVVILHCITVGFFTPFFWVRNVEDTLSSICMIPLSCGSSWSFL